MSSQQLIYFLFIPALFIPNLIRFLNSFLGKVLRSQPLDLDPVVLVNISGKHFQQVKLRIGQGCFQFMCHKTYKFGERTITYLPTA